MRRPIRVLHVEDDPIDAELVGNALPKGAAACEIRVVGSRPEFLRLYRDWKPDVILSDYNVPAFSGLDALDLVRGEGSDIPFIFVSGTIGEGKAVEVLRRGATDYVLKDRLARLPSAIERSMEGREERRQRIEAERALGNIAETIREAFWMLSPDRSRVLYANPAFEKIWGCPLSAIVGVSPAKLMESIHAEDRPRAEAGFALLGEKDVEGEYRILRPDGELRWVRFRWYAVRDRGGDVERVIGTAEDVTEPRRLREQFLQSQKMEAVGRLAGGVVHDFNNLLTIIAGYAELALARLGEAEPAREMVREIRDAGERAAHLTRQLLSFSRKQTARPVLLDLGRVVADLDKMLRRLIGDQIRLESSTAHCLWAVEADRGQIEQALMNLVVNARDAMPPEGGVITIAADNVDLAAGARIGLDPVEAAGRYVRVSVSDTGSGMSPDILSHLFEPFFTTKDVGKGTGLGLSTVHSIVRQNGGYIEASSKPGLGSTFGIYLPRASKNSETDRRLPTPAGAVADGVATVLLVDDSETLRKLCSEILKSGGYRVQAVESGPAALRILDSDLPVQLLLSDIMMPGMTGPELLERAMRTRKGLRILLMSGYADPSMGGPGLQALPGVSVLQKPFTREGLLDKVREVLQTSPTRNAT